ncbi:DUF5674 family protein [Brachyspira hyodysenteriae]|uniref:DUF5674 family protein n=1 Tax=Brachyspira hyodysenteriae TaxID=159 RepID=UPI00063DBAA4|nr:DUF5674 family protein [Brachyspira hyodysenteriae]KLI61310.1 hypothetical protein SZ44_03175 [Brachyspira hyodysenteriae]HJH55614.1 DUF5674 family protein [Brachyspira hyodysenteriae]
MIIIKEGIEVSEIKNMLGNYFTDMVKGVVDIEKNELALDAELHSDLESLLIENGSLQKDLWGINIYPELDDEDFIEFDSWINIKPTDNNRSRYVEDENIRNKIIEILDNLIIK